MKDFGPYLTRRAFRIFPIYWFALIFALVLTQAYSQTYTGTWVLEQDMRTARAMAVDESFGTHLLLHVSLLHGLVPDNFLPFSSTAFLAPAWSLSLEWQFYVVAPLLVAVLAKPGFSRWTAVLLLSATWVIFKKVLQWPWQYPAALPLSIQFFMLGILSRVFLPALSKAGDRLLFLGLLTAVFGPRNVRLEIGIWSVFLTSACMQFRESKFTIKDRGGEFLSFITHNQAARRLGEFSYSTYLIHILLFSAVGWAIASLTGQWNQSITIWSTASALVLLVPISALLYRHIEQRFIRLGAALTQPSNLAAKRYQS